MFTDWHRTCNEVRCLMSSDILLLKAVKSRQWITSKSESNLAKLALQRKQRIDVFSACLRCFCYMFNLLRLTDKLVNLRSDYSTNHSKLDLFKYLYTIVRFYCTNVTDLWKVKIVSTIFYALHYLMQIVYRMTRNLSSN